MLGWEMAATRPVMLVVHLDHQQHRRDPVRCTRRQFCLWWLLQSDLLQLVRLWWQLVPLLLCLVLWCLMRLRLLLQLVRLWWQLVPLLLCLVLWFLLRFLLLLQLVRLWWQLVPLLLCLVQWFLLRLLLLLLLPTMEAEGVRKKCATIGQTDATTTKC